MEEEKANSDKSSDPGGLDDLRQRTEDVRERQPEEMQEMPAEDIQRLIREFQEQQSDLLMQNKKLRRTQRELERARDRYQDLYVLAPVGYLTLGETGLILEANLTAATMLDVERDRLIEQPLSRFVADEDAEAYHLHHRRLFETREPQTRELRMARGDGSPFWARLEARASVDREGKAVCRAILSDISQRKRTQTRSISAMSDASEALWESEERYRRLADLTSDYIYALRVEPEGGLVVEWMTDNFTRITGYQAQASDQRTMLSQLIHPDDISAVRRHLETCLLNHKDVIECRIVTQDDVFPRLRQIFGPEEESYARG